MLAAHVDAPLRLHIELFDLLLLQVVDEGLDRLSVRYPDEGCCDDVFEAGLQLFIDPLVEELDVVCVVFHHVPQAVLDVIFGAVNDITHLSKAQLGLDHPELGQVT